MKKHYPVELLDRNDMVVYYPSNLVVSPIQRIAFGTFSIEAACKPHPKEKNTISISQKVAEYLRVPRFQGPLHIFIHEQTMYIGPLIGIFTSGFTPFPMRPVGERTLFFSKLLSVKKTIGAYAFVFGEEHINWEKGTIDGLFYHENGWESIEVPFPNVVYDRLPNRRSERKTELTQTKHRLQTDYLIPWYNPGFFNKLDVYERLQQHEACLKYLPETHPFTSFSIIERMLSEYGHVYVKPTNGSLGLGIHQIIYDKEKESYYCRYRDRDGENRLRRFNTLEALFNNVLRNRVLSSMLVQQGIHLIRQNKRPIDFRVHTNKNEHGDWMVTAMAAKVGGLGSVTTHVKNGGSIKTIAEIAETKEEQNEIIRKLTTACLNLSIALEEQMEGIIGEIGFDMGIDRDGHVWLFEANSKPGRSIFKHPHLREFDLLTRKLSLAYSVFLTEKAIIHPEDIFK